MKNGPEIIDFRPVIEFLAALANRRLQPLGHLTAEEFLSIDDIAGYAKAIVPTTVPEIVPASHRIRRENRAEISASACSKTGSGFFQNQASR